MHRNPAFRRVDDARSLELVWERSFGILIAQGAEGPLASHIRFCSPRMGGSSSSTSSETRPWRARLQMARPFG